MIVMKFGGTSVGSGERILNVARLVLDQADREPLVVTSAMSGVTDTLLAIVEAIGRGDAAVVEAKLSALEQRHREAAKHISRGVTVTIRVALEELRHEVAALLADRDASLQASDAIVSWGERLAVMLVTGAIAHVAEDEEAAWYHDDPLIVTDDQFGAATPNWEATATVANAIYDLVLQGIHVTPGFLGQRLRDPDGERVFTTLGRGGSDYSATIIAAALGAEACWIYTDVDGVSTADPRVVKEAEVLPVVTAAVAGRLAMCGAKVLHPRSVAPVARAGIELRVRNTFKPDHPGTLIVPADPAASGQPRAVAGRKRLTALGLAGHGLTEIPNLFGRMCAAVTEAGAEIILSSHPVPGHTPEVIIETALALAAVARLTAEFAQEAERGQVASIQRRDNLALCVLVGEDLSAALLLQAQRALAGEHIVPVSQSANADALCFVLLESAVDRAVRALHRAVIIPARQAEAKTAQRPYPDGQWAEGGRPAQRRRITSPQH